MATHDDSDVAVTHSIEQGQFEIDVDGTRAGLTQYRDRGNQRIFFHTEIGEQFGGRGLGSALLGRALADTRDAGLRVVPVCEFVAGYLAKHHEFDDITDPVTHEARQAVARAS